MQSVFKTPTTIKPWALGTQTGSVWGAWHTQRPPVLPEEDAQTSSSQTLPSIIQQDASKDQPGRGMVPAASSAWSCRKVWDKVSPRERCCSEPSCFYHSHFSLTRSPVPQFPHLGQQLAWGAAGGGNVKLMDYELIPRGKRRVLLPCSAVCPMPWWAAWLPGFLPSLPGDTG